jgi:hypothetical protein
LQRRYIERERKSNVEGCRKKMDKERNLGKKSEEIKRGEK